MCSTSRPRGWRGCGDGSEVARSRGRVHFLVWVFVTRKYSFGAKNRNVGVRRGGWPCDIRFVTDWPPFRTQPFSSLRKMIASL